MIRHKSAEKRNRQNAVRRQGNKAQLTTTRTIVKKIRLAISNGDQKTAKELLPQVQSQLAKLAKRNLIKRNTLARKLSRLSRQAQSC